jgi:hypothetical protein
MMQSGGDSLSLNFLPITETKELIDMVQLLEFPWPLWSRAAIQFVFEVGVNLHFQSSGSPGDLVLFHVAVSIKEPVESCGLSVSCGEGAHPHLP